MDPVPVVGVLADHVFHTRGRALGGFPDCFLAVALADPPGQRPAARKSKLDLYKPMVDRLLGEGVWNAQVILREIQAAGYRTDNALLIAMSPSSRAISRTSSVKLKS
jgi:hypothetical protein